MNWHEVFDYDPDTGKLFWKISPSKSVKIGQEAGSTRADNDGSEFKILRFNGTTKLIHHVVWEMFNGPIAPGEVIRHKNKDRTDNRIENLIKMRRGSIAHGTSIRTDNTSGVKGVGFHKRYGKWVARIYVDGRPIYLGAYDKLENAAKARRQAEIKYGFTVNGAEK